MEVKTPGEMLNFVISPRDCHSGVCNFVHGHCSCFWFAATCRETSTRPLVSENTYIRMTIVWKLLTITNTKRNRIRWRAWFADSHHVVSADSKLVDGAWIEIVHNCRRRGDKGDWCLPMAHSSLLAFHSVRGDRAVAVAVWSLPFHDDRWGGDFCDRWSRRRWWFIWR